MSALKHKSATYCSEEMLADLYKRSRVSIEVLVANMVRPEICNHILFAFYQDVTKRNVIKLLMRVMGLYDARTEAVSILKIVMEVEALIQPASDLWRIIQDNSSAKLNPSYHDMIHRVLHKLSNALMRITIFQEEHRLFHGEFEFNQKEYREYIRDIGAIIGGFLRHKGESNPALQETGLLQQEHDEHERQTERYNEWVGESIKNFGRMEMPLPSEVERTIPIEKIKKQSSKIDQALERMRQEEAKRKERDAAKERTSKSQMLKEMQLRQSRLEELSRRSQAAREAQEEWQKSSMSDQLVERQQVSASKRERTTMAMAGQQMIHHQGTMMTTSMQVSAERNQEYRSTTQFAGIKKPTAIATGHIEDF